MIDINTLAVEFRTASETLRRLRDEQFPRGAFVRYHGSYCIASIGDGCPPDKLPLIFENGNTWWKPVEECEPVADIRSLPRSARRMKASALRLQARRGSDDKQEATPIYDLH